jgi:hypothetical protein
VLAQACQRGGGSSWRHDDNTRPPEMGGGGLTTGLAAAIWTPCTYGRRQLPFPSPRPRQLPREACRTGREHGDRRLQNLGQPNLMGASGLSDLGQGGRPASLTVSQVPGASDPGSPTGGVVVCTRPVEVSGRRVNTRQRWDRRTWDAKRLVRDSLRIEALTSDDAGP